MYVLEWRTVYVLTIGLSVWYKTKFGSQKFDFLVIWSLMMQYPPLTQFGQTNLANSIFVTSQPPLYWYPDPRSAQPIALIAPNPEPATTKRIDQSHDTTAIWWPLGVAVESSDKSLYWTNLLSHIKDSDGLHHRPYSRQVTEQLPLSGSLHSH